MFSWGIHSPRRFSINAVVYIFKELRTAIYESYISIVYITIVTIVISIIIEEEK